MATLQPNAGSTVGAASPHRGKVRSTKENGRIRGRPLFCVLEFGVRLSRELPTCGPSAYFLIFAQMLLPTNPTSVTALVEAISRPRLSNYRSFFAASDDAQILGLYQWNEELSGALFRTISLAEVVLRNQFHKVMSAHYGAAGSATSRDWYNHIALKPLSQAKIRDITHQKHHSVWLPRLPSKSPDDVVSKLTFGFWPHLLDVTTDTSGATIDWGSLLLSVVPGHRQRQATYWAKQSSRDALFGRLDLINELRNRIAHHEPIWKLGPLMAESRPRQHHPLLQRLPAPVSPAEAIARLGMYYARLTELLHWLSPQLAAAYKGSDADVKARSLLSESALMHYRHQRRQGSAQIGHFAGNQRLRKLLKYASRQRQPLTILDGANIIGHWTCPVRP